jgi:hypothetical protein
MAFAPSHLFDFKKALEALEESRSQLARNGRWHSEYYLDYVCSTLSEKIKALAASIEKEDLSTAERIAKNMVHSFINYIENQIEYQAESHGAIDFMEWIDAGAFIDQAKQIQRELVVLNPSTTASYAEKISKHNIALEALRCEQEKLNEDAHLQLLLKTVARLKAGYECKQVAVGFAWPVVSAEELASYSSFMSQLKNHLALAGLEVTEIPVSVPGKAAKAHYSDYLRMAKINKTLIFIVSPEIGDKYSAQANIWRTALPYTIDNLKKVAPYAADSICMLNLHHEDFIAGFNMALQLPITYLKILQQFIAQAYGLKAVKDIHALWEEAQKAASPEAVAVVRSVLASSDLSSPVDVLTPTI